MEITCHSKCDCLNPDKIKQFFLSKTAYKRAITKVSVEQNARTINTISLDESTMKTYKIVIPHQLQEIA